MKSIKQLFDFYINSSIHVAVAVFSLLLMTNYMFKNPFDMPMSCFAFFGTIAGYNFIKYGKILYNKKTILILTIAAAIVAGCSFFMLERIAQITAVIFFLLLLLYAIPLLPKKKNMRNWSGVKIYIVALCWAGITLLLPLQNANTPISTDVYLKFGQRFLLVIILILIFEIIDLKKDDPLLKTVPQSIGVKKTKYLNLFLLIPFYFLEFLKTEVNSNQLIINIVLVFVTAVFTLFATTERSKYYTSFWVESLPIFWLGLVVFFG